MKGSLPIVLALFCGCAGSTRPPKPSPTHPFVPQIASTADDVPIVEDGDTSIATRRGIRMIVRRVPGAEFAAAQLCVRGGVWNWTAQQAGIERLALRMAVSGGTTSLSKPQFAERLDVLGAATRVEARNDFSAIAVTVPRAGWGDAFALLAQAFLSPALPADEFEAARQEALTTLQHESESPEGRLWTLERQQIFDGHPYSRRPTGTVESVGALRLGDIAPYLRGIRQRRRLLFVAVGDLDAARVMEQVDRAFADVPLGSGNIDPIPPVSFDRPRIVSESRPLPTNYVQSVFAIPNAGDPLYATGLVAIAALSARISNVLRGNRVLSYAAGASAYALFARPLGSINVTSNAMDEAMRLTFEEVRRLQEEPIQNVELAGYKALFLTNHLQQHETVSGQASALADAELLGGDWRLARTLPDRVRAITSDDVRSFAQRHMVRMQTAVVGDLTKVDLASLSAPKK